MKNKFKKLTGFFFAAVMTLVALPIQTFASEWGVGDNVYAAMLGNYIGSDGGTYGDKYNYDYIYYKSDGSVGTATRYASTHAKLGVSKNGVTQQAICIEAGVSYSTGSSYVGKASSDDYMLMLPTKARRDLKIALLCGFNSTVTKSPVANTNLDDFSFATQTITWEIQQGLRTGYGKSDLAVNPKIPNTPKTAYYDQLKGRPAEKCYEYILNKMKSFSLLPSFTSADKTSVPVHTMEYNSSTKKYSITLPDSNKSNMPASAFNIPGVTVTKSGYDYTFSTTSKISGTKACTYKANRTSGKQLVVWKSNGGASQTMADGIDDPVQFYANFKTSDLGTAQIKKVWQHNGDQTASNKDIYFTIKNSAGAAVKGTGSAGSYTYSASGSVSQFRLNSSNTFLVKSLPTGTYTVTEHGSTDYTISGGASKTVTVPVGGTGVVTFTNARNTGSLRVQKSFSDADNLTTAQLQSLYKSLKFTVKNSDGKYVTAKATSSDGVYTFSGSSTTPQYYTVNSNGAFRIDKVPTGSYVITETAWDNKYTPAHVTVTAKVTSNATVTADYPNNRNTGTGRVTKTLDNASALTADEKKDIYASIRFTVKTADGKYVTATATALPGVYNYTGASKTAREYKINSNGVFRIDKIPTGTYALTETSCDDNYTPSVATKKFTVRANETTQVSYENTRDKGSLRVQKLFSDADNLTTAQKQELYKTLKFTVKNSDGKYVTAKATSSDGVYTFSGSSTTPQYYTVNIYGAFRIDKVPTGSYVITETAWDNKYTPAHVTVTAKVTSNATVTADYPNNRNTGTGRVTKTLDNASALTADEKKDIYASIRFTVKTADGKYVTAATTSSPGVYNYTGTSKTAQEYKINSNGVFRIDKMPTGTYALTETSCDDNYTPSVATKKFTVRVNETTQVSYENTRDKGNGRIYKKWVSADTLTKDQIIALGNNVYFTVKTADGKYVTAATTSSPGVYNYTGTASTVQKYKLNTSTIAFRIDNMPTGTYTVTEYCSADGFNGYTAGTSSAPTTQTKTITVVKGATKSVKFTNKSVPIVVIRKHFSDEDNLTDEELKAQYAKVTVNLQVLGIAGKVQSTPPAGYYVNFTGSNGNYTFKDVTATKSSASDLKLDDNGKITISFGTNTTPYYMSVIENYSGTDYETDNRDQRIDLGDGNPNTVIELDDIEINNQLKSGSVQIDKEFLNENGAIENITDEQLAEVTFKIAHNGKYLTFTGADGAYTYNGENNAGTALKLNKSTYNFIASKLPAKEEYTVMEVSGTMGYSFSIDPVTFTITPAGTVKKVFTNRAMTGTISIVKHSADGVLSGWQFRVTGTAITGQKYDKTFTTDAKGTIIISNLRIGDYKVIEVKTDKTVGYITEDSKDIEVQPDTITTVNFTNKPYGHIVINKVDAKTGEKVTGASFGIFTDSACKTVAKAYKSETDSSLVNAVITEIENGKYTCNFLPIGNAEGTVYYIKELTAPDGYYLDKNTYAVVLKTANATVSIDNEFGKSDFNEYPYGHATIIKEWKLDNSTADMTADEIAQMKAELEKGLYFTVKNSNGKYITATGADGVYKYNSESATEFRYILKNGAFVIAELPTGEYTVTEYSALPDYTIKSENPVKITVVRNQTAKATFVNERDTGTGKVIKVWKQFDTMTAAEQTEIEKNVYFTVTDSNGAYLKVKESNGSYIYCGAQKTETKFVLKNGAFVIAELPTGEYTVTEFNNAKDYSPKQQTQKIKIAKNTAAVLTFTNIRDTGNASIVKKWTNPNGLTTAQKATLEQNVYFTVKNADGTYLKAVSKNGKYVYNGSQTAEARFMLTNGKFELAELPTGKYTITEINNAEGYLPKTQVKTITVTKDATLSAEFVNKVIVGNVTLTKVDEDYPENKLTGAVFTVYKSDKKTVVGTMKEIETGVYQLEGLAFGEYYVQETKAPEYFVRDINFYYFQIVNDGETVEVSNDELGKGTFINAPQKGEIKIVKTSYDKKVEGFHFEVTGKTYTGQDFKKTYTTDKNGIIIITDLRAGEYTIHEVKDTASAGYVLPADVQLTIDRDGAMLVANMHNSKLPDNPPTGASEDSFTQTAVIIISTVMMSAAVLLAFPLSKRKRKR